MGLCCGWEGVVGKTSSTNVHIYIKAPAEMPNGGGGREKKKAAAWPTPSILFYAYHSAVAVHPTTTARHVLG